MDIKEIEKLVKHLEPTEIEYGWGYKVSINAPKLEKDMRVISLWWD
ncbi:MAG: hypothetical protein ACFFAS_05130 [Promethearchaeota archaeon]